MSGFLKLLPYKGIGLGVVQKLPLIVLNLYRINGTTSSSKMSLVVFHRAVCYARCYIILYTKDLPNVLKHSR